MITACAASHRSSFHYELLTQPVPYALWVMIRFRSPISLAREEFVHAHEQCRPLRRSPFTPLAGLPATPREDNPSLFQDSVLSSPRVIPPVRGGSHFLRCHRYLTDCSAGTLPARGFATCSLFWTTTRTRIDYPERQSTRGSRNPRSLPISPSIGDVPRSILQAKLPRLANSSGAGKD